MSDIRDDSSRPRKRQAANGTGGRSYDATKKTANDESSNGLIAEDGKGADTSQDADQGWVATARGVAFTTVPTWVNAGIMVSLIFGGCCANVRYSPSRMGSRL